MKFKIAVLVLLSFSEVTILYSQTFDLNTKSNIIIRKYTGGRPKYSKVSLILYSDSTYVYSNWYHFGQTEKDIGKYLITDTTLVLYSKNYFNSKKNKQSTKYNLFTGKKYRIQNNLLKLFSKKQEKQENSDFYRQHFTLHRVD